MKKAERPLRKVTLNLFEDQLELLQELNPDVGASAIIRRLIDSYIKQVKGTGGTLLNADVEIKL